MSEETKTEKPAESTSAAKELESTPGAGENCKKTTQRLSRYRNVYRNARKNGEAEGLSFRAWMRSLDELVEGPEMPWSDRLRKAHAQANQGANPKPKTYKKGNQDNPGANKQKVKQAKKKKKPAEEE